MFLQFRPFLTVLDVLDTNFEVLIVTYWFHKVP